MNCTAWNSVGGEGADEQPERHPERRIPDGESGDGPLRPVHVEAEEPEGERRDDRRLDRGEQAEGEPVPAEQVELPDRHRHQPLERSRRPLAQHRHGGDEEHRDEREEPEERRADCWKIAGVPREDRLQERLEHAGDGEDERRASSDRGAAARAPEPRSRRCSPAGAAGGRRLAALGLEAEEDLVERARPRPGAELRGRPGGDQRSPPAAGAGRRSARPRPSRGSRRAASPPRSASDGRAARGRGGAAGRARPSARRARAARVCRGARSRARRGPAGRPRASRRPGQPPGGARRCRSPRRSGRARAGGAGAK